MVGGDLNAAMGGPNDHDKACGPHSLTNTNNAGQELRNMISAEPTLTFSNI